VTSIGLPACPACGAVDGWIIESPVAAIDRARVDASGLELLGLFAPEDGLEPIGRPAIACAACATIADIEELRVAVLGAATTRSTTH
jgi:hypothetical protein